MNASSEASIDEIVGKFDIVISLLPSTKASVHNGIDLVNVLYISLAMAALHYKDIENNETLLNEIELVPGLGHAFTMQLLGSK